MTDSKEWVTIKIPESIRNKAKSDPRTYGQIMQAGLDNEPFVTEGDVEFEPFVDYEEIAEIITDKIEETNGVLIENVEIDESGTTMERSEIEGIIENWVERNYDRLRRGEL